MPVRKRSTTAQYKGQSRASIFTDFKPYTSVSTSLTEETVSLGHNINMLGTGDVGGPFLHRKTTYQHSPGRAVGTTVNGEVIIAESFPQYTRLGKPTEPSSTLLNSRGTTAIARTEPTDSVFSASTFAGELARDGIPSIPGVETWRARTHLARSSGSEYLNVEFGWMPFVSDLRKFAYAVKNSEKIITSYKRGSGKKTRRRYQFPVETISRSYTGSISVLPSAAGVWRGAIVESTSSQSWFSGAFTYYLGEGEGNFDKISRYGSYARKLFGVELTPEVVWNLAPWSWAADWFGTVGDVMHNVSALGRDGLVMQYGYVMHENTRHLYANASSTQYSSSASVHVKDLFQVRTAATPYGFGVDLKSLSAKQIAILAALGLSRT